MPLLHLKQKRLHKRQLKSYITRNLRVKILRCSLSETKHRLFIGNVPKTWTEDKFKKVIEAVGLGAENIELVKDVHNTRRNRGFAFVLYYNNACADFSRQKMSSANFKLDGNIPTVTWADPKYSADNSASSQLSM